MKIRTEKENNELKGGVDKITNDPRNEIYFILDNIKSMLNVGAIFRTADALRAKKIYLCGITATPPRRKIYKTSMGTVNLVDWQYFEKVSDAIAELRKQGVQIIALEQTKNSIHFKKAKYKAPIAIILGHEKEGVSEQALEQSDIIVELPMEGFGNSINVATSAGVVGYEVLHQIKKRP